MKDGGLVFPAKCQEHGVSHGMTVHDLYVSLALHGLVIGSDLDKMGHPDHERAAKFCHDAADAMIREKGRRNASKRD